MHNRELVKFVSLEGVPVVVDDDVINSLRKVKEEKVEIETYDGLQSGLRVRITDGHLIGAEGVLVRKNGKDRFMIHVEALKRTVYVEVSAANVEVIDEVYDYSSEMAVC